MSELDPVPPPPAPPEEELQFGDHQMDIFDDDNDTNNPESSLPTIGTNKPVREIPPETQDDLNLFDEDDEISTGGKEGEHADEEAVAGDEEEDGGEDEDEEEAEADEEGEDEDDVDIDDDEGEFQRKPKDSKKKRKRSEKEGKSKKG
jgi:hypothetical protein